MHIFIYLVKLGLAEAW